MTDLEVGQFEVDAPSRRIRGTLLPWDEPSRTSRTKNAPVKFSKGTVRVPRDVSIVTLNRNHDRYDPVGYAAKLEPRERGLYAEFDIADTEEGDQWLADHQGLVRLSPELRDITRDQAGGASATLTGAALVTEGAFASAGLFAVDDSDKTEEPEPVEAAVETTDVESPTEVTEPTGESDEEEEEEAVAEATATEVMLAGRGQTPVEKKESGLFASKGAYFKALDDVMGGRASYETRQKIAQSLPGEAGLFALSDVDYDGVAGVGAKMTPTAWIGEVLDGTTYNQRYAPLFGQRTLSGLAMAGWKWGVKPAGATWTGNKDAISSNTPTIVPVTESATRWAGGHDIAREHRDFGTPGFFEAYDAAMRESFDRWLDTTIVLTEALAGATDLEADNPAGLDIGAGWSAVIDGAAAIVAAGLTPTSAVVSPELWKAMAKVPNSDVLGYLNASLSLTGEGRLDTFTIVPAAPGQLTVGHVLVISREAGDVYTLPGSPIRAEALNIANGGIDVGFFGYGGFLIKNAAGIVDVAPYTP